MPQIVAFVLVVTEVGKEYEVRDKILEVARREGVEVEAYVVFGEYDVAVKLSANDLRSIDRAVTAIRNLGGVLRTVTLIASA